MSGKKDWDKIYRDNSSRLLGMVRRYVGDKELAEDILHDSFIMAIKKEKSYNATGSFEGWLRKIVLNCTFQFIRKNNKSAFLTDDSNLILSDINEKEIPGNEDSTEKATFELSELMEAIDMLPPHHKSVFNLYVLDNFKHNQIGEILGISPGTSKSHLARGRKKLQKTLLDKAKTKKEERRSFLWLFLSVDWEMNMDNTFQKAFIDYTIPPLKTFNNGIKNNKLVEAFKTLQQLKLFWLLLVLSLPSPLSCNQMIKSLLQLNNLSKAALILFQVLRIIYYQKTQ